MVGFCHGGNMPASHCQDDQDSDVIDHDDIGDRRNYTTAGNLRRHMKKTHWRIVKQ